MWFFPFLSPSVRVASLIPATSPDTVPVTSRVGGTHSPEVASLEDMASNLQITEVVNCATSTGDISRSSVETVAPREQFGAINTENLSAHQNALASTSSLTPKVMSADYRTPSPAPIRIMSRNSNASPKTRSGHAVGSISSVSSQSSAITSSALRISSTPNTLGMTFEERETAYAEARSRIFSQGSSATSQEGQPSNTFIVPVHMPLQMQGQLSPTDPFAIEQVLRPSAPAFVYQPMLPGADSYTSGYQYAQSTHLPQSLAFTSVPAGPFTPTSSVVSASIQMTVPQSATANSSKYVPSVSFAQEPIAEHLEQNQQFSGMMDDSLGAGHLDRPAPARSHSSHSSTSIATSASSIRTASTSSVSTRAIPSSRLQGLDLRPMRQIPSPSHRQPWTSLSTSISVSTPADHASGARAGSSNTSTTSSANSRHSHSSSSTSTSTTTSRSASGSGSGSASVSARLSSNISLGTGTNGGVKSRPGSETSSTTSSTKGKEVNLLPNPHPSLPRKPEWIPTSKSTKLPGEVSEQNLSSKMSAIKQEEEQDPSRFRSPPPSEIDITRIRLSISSEPPKAPEKIEEGPHRKEGQEPLTSTKEVVYADEEKCKDMAQSINEDDVSSLLSHAQPEPEPQAQAQRSMDKANDTNQMEGSKIIEYPPLRSVTSMS